jgi:tRNA(fMet)-specific endonuclease VapC
MAVLRHMLDTDSVSFALRGEGDVGARLLTVRPSAVCLSSITVAELRYGADKRRSRKLHRLIDAFVAPLTISVFDVAAAVRYGAVASALERRGTPIGGFDALIAAHALSLGLTLVTRNTKHFGRVEGLTLESWF